MYLLIIIWPLIGAICTGFLSYNFGKKEMLRVSIISMLFSCILVQFAFWNLSLQNKVCYISLGDWITSELLIIRWGFLFDNLTIMMFIVVTTVSMLVHIYSISYMKEDPHLPRFMSYLSLFTFFMLILVSADNFIQLFLGWEGVGLCSYLLISFWFTRIQANKAAIKAMVMNRIGDFGLFLGILITFFIF
jgi:NADH-ubiquinone oxidoreductase chain 5